MSDEQTGRINQLEESLAHQEMMVNELSDELAKQWQTIERLTRKIKNLEDKIDSLRMTADSPAAGDRPPPHY